MFRNGDDDNEDEDDGDNDIYYILDLIVACMNIE
jgi:hypothetical protein